METINSGNIVNKEQIILLCSKALRMYDERLAGHGERVAYLAELIGRKVYGPEEMDFDKLLILSLFHDIGAYKTEELDRMLEFESKHVYQHSVYGYLFLKYFSPLDQYSEAVLYHHLSNEAYKDFDFMFKDYSNLIHLADRIDIAIMSGCKKEELVKRLRIPRFCRKQVDAFEEILLHTNVYEDMQDNRLSPLVLEHIRALPLSLGEAVQYLKMLVFTIDFKSEYTVEHSVNTTFISWFLAKEAGLSGEELERIYFAAMLHDIGKIAIPTEILEYPGKLSQEQMEVMKKHVEFTEDILRDSIEDMVLHIAVRHHEKLDGSGYPRGLYGADLTVSDRIVAIADIVSALISRRSYKHEFSRDKTIAILEDWAKEGKLDGGLVAIVKDKYETIISQLDEKTAPVRQIYENIQAEYKMYIQVLAEYEKDRNERMKSGRMGAGC